VPAAIGDFLILDAIRESGGFAAAVDDAEIEDARAEMAAREGLLLCPEGAATYAALRQELASGRISKDERVVLFNCGSGLKYDMPRADQTLDLAQPIDYATL
jgi:threonine synthase